MAQDNPDVYKILRDLELKATGLDEKTNKQQEGYFVAWRDIGLPIRKEDFDDPWNPSRRAKVPPMPGGTDPSEQEEHTASAELDPEQVYNDALLTEITRQQRAYVNTFLLTDSKLQMNPLYRVMPGATKVSDTWWTILTGANGIPGKLELSPEVQAAYDKAQAYLYDEEEDEPTRKYEKYLEYQDAYDSAVQEYAQEYADAFTDPQRLAMWPMQGTYFRKSVDKAWKRWVALGYKEKVESALNTLAAQGQDPAMALISRAKQKFHENLFDFPGVGMLPLTQLIPSGWADERDDRGWNDYTSTNFRQQRQYTRSSTSYGGAGGFSIGLWSVAGGLDGGSDKEEMSMQMNNLEVSFKYMMVDVFRPWMGAELLNLDNWFLYGDYPAGTISKGTFNQEMPSGDGFEPAFLPSIVTSLICVKDVRIKWDNWQDSWNSETSRLSGRGGFGWGPFAIGGRYGSSNHSFEAETARQSEGLHMPGIQLLGYVSQIVPRSPRKNGADYLQTVDVGE